MFKNLSTCIRIRIRIPISVKNAVLDPGDKVNAVSDQCHSLQNTVTRNIFLNTAFRSLVCSRSYKIANISSLSVTKPPPPMFWHLKN